MDNFDISANWFEQMVNEYGEEKAARQLSLEAEAKDTAEALVKERLQDQAEDGSFGDTKTAQSFTAVMVAPVAEYLREWVDTAEAAGKGKKHSALKLIRMLPVNVDEKNGITRYDMLAAIGLKKALGYAMSKTDVSVIGCFRAIGAAVGSEVFAMQYLASLAKGRRKLIVAGLQDRHEDTYRRAYLNACANHDGFEFNEWLDSEMLRCGEVIVDAIIHTGILEMMTVIPVGKTQREAKSRLVPSEDAATLISKFMGQSILLAQRHQPMIIPPREWKDAKSGGYWTPLTDMERRAGLTDSLFRIATFVDREVRENYYANTLEQANLDEVLAAVNHMQNTAWAINKGVLAVAKAVFSEHYSGTAGLPPVEPLAKLPRLEEGTYTEEELRVYRKRKTELAKAELRRSSRAMRTSTIISTAARFADEEAIYFPHSLDTRGRIYPIPAFNPQGDDLTKGLLMAASAEPIGTPQNAFLWKVHGCNTFGLDKLPLRDRADWVDAHEDDILAAGNDPLANMHFWAKADSPFCFLAFCIDYVGFKKDKLAHCSRIICAFDGSCSGIQHYSAMLRDEIGGSAVNLIPGMPRQDIYQLVADKVNVILESAAMSGDSNSIKIIENEGEEDREYMVIGSLQLAQEWLAFGVTRNVTKRSVMTLAYGSKEYGFKDQIMEDTIQPAIEKAGGVEVSPWQSASQAARYMAKLIWAAVQEVVVKAVEAMTWLQKVAGLVAKTNTPVTWWTPDNLPVVQFYFKNTSKRIKFLINGQTKLYTQTTGTREIDRHKQGSGIAPNFIHSLDATHMRMTIIKAYALGVRNFGMIHDSFGTTASHASVMFGAVRSTMVDMYVKHDPLKELCESIRDSLPEELAAEIPPLPEHGKLDINGINRSEFAFA